MIETEGDSSSAKSFSIFLESSSSRISVDGYAMIFFPALTREEFFSVPLDLFLEFDVL